MWRLTSKTQKFIDLFWEEWDKWREGRSPSSRRYWSPEGAKITMVDILPTFISEHPHLNQMMTDLDIDYQDIIFLSNIVSAYDPNIVKLDPTDEMHQITLQAVPTIEKALEYQERGLTTEIMSPEELEKQFQLEQIKRIAAQID